MDRRKGTFLLRANKLANRLYNVYTMHVDGGYRCSQHHLNGRRKIPTTFHVITWNPTRRKPFSTTIP